MFTSPPIPQISRRAALHRLGLAGLGAVLSFTHVYSMTGSAAAGATRIELATHPIIGHWLAVTALGPCHIVFDGTGGVLVVWPHSVDGPNGYYEYTTSASGTWRPVSDHGVDFMVVVPEDSQSSADGTALTMMESHPVVSPDMGTCHSEASKDRITSPAPDVMATILRDSDGWPLPLSGIRMWPEEASA